MRIDKDQIDTAEIISFIHYLFMLYYEPWAAIHCQTKIKYFFNIEANKSTKGHIYVIDGQNLSLSLPKILKL